VLFGLGLGAGFLLNFLVPVRIVPARFEGEAAFAGAAIGVLFLAFGGWAFLGFLRAKTTPHPNHPVSALVTSGPYRFSRNPMYVGLSGFVAGLALLANAAWVAAMLVPVWIAMNRLVIAREEVYLERKFGEDYRAFRKRTRRWL
jgi:protein-S-isoprenylcysteine O-methyltransferase Ste14